MSLKDIMTKLGKSDVPLAKVAILAKVPLDDAVSARETPAKVANLANLPPAERWRVSIEQWHPKAQDQGRGTRGAHRAPLAAGAIRRIKSP